MTNPQIKLENVEYYYNQGSTAEVHALKKINIEIGRGEYVAFFGPSGCGKSTLLYLVAGIERPYSGKIIVSYESVVAGKIVITEKDIATLSDDELAVYRQATVGIIFQNFNLIPSISVLENVAMPLSFLGISKPKRTEKAKKILDRLGIGSFANRYPFELSGGQQQRVGIARALANNPSIILADEPLGNLDSDNAKAVLAYIEESHKKDGRTVIMVTHEAWSLTGAEKIFYMKDGDIVKTAKQVPTGQALASPSESFTKMNFKTPNAEVRAESLSRFVFQGFPQNEVNRLEKFLLSLFRSEISLSQFKEKIDSPFKEGGAGLKSQTASKITETVREFLFQSKKLEYIYQKLSINKHADISLEIKSIRSWLAAKIKNLSEEEGLTVLDHYITERIKNKMTGAQFIHDLNLAKKYGGVGLRIDSALYASENLETLLGEKVINSVQL